MKSEGLKQNMMQAVNYSVLRQKDMKNNVVSTLLHLSFLSAYSSQPATLASAHTVY